MLRHTSIAAGPGHRSKAPRRAAVRDASPCRARRRRRRSWTRQWSLTSPPADAGPDQESTQVHHPAFMPEPLPPRPADPTVPRFQLQRRRAETDRSQPPMLRGDQIPQLATHEASLPLRMLPSDPLIPGSHRRVILRLDQNHTQAPNLPSHLGNPLRCGNCPFQSPRTPLRHDLELPRREPEMTGGLQIPKCFQAREDLTLAPSVTKAGLLTQRGRQPRARPRPLRTELALHDGELCRLGEGILDRGFSAAHAEGLPCETASAQTDSWGKARTSHDRPLARLRHFSGAKRIGRASVLRLST